MSTFKRVIVAAILAGGVGPVLLTPLVVWLDVHPHGRVAPWVELLFMYLWPTSVMLMAGAGTQPLTGPYWVLLSLAVLANIIAFGAAGLLLALAYAAVRRFMRGHRPQPPAP